MKKKIEDIKINISEKLELPMDITMDLPKISLIGNREVSIANHKGIIEYTSDIIRINSKIGILKIMGFEMEIKNILMEEILISGYIDSIQIIS